LWRRSSFEERALHDDAKWPASSSLFRQKQRGEVVEKAPAQFRRPDVVHVPLYESFLLCLPQRSFDDGERQLRLLREQRDGKALVETQRVQHEFEAGLAAGQGVRACNARLCCRLFHVLARMTQLGAALDALRIRAAELAVRAGTDAEVVAEQPVVEIVPAAMSRARVSGDLVLRITLLGKTRLTAYDSYTHLRDHQTASYHVI